MNGLVSAGDVDEVAVERVLQGRGEFQLLTSDERDEVLRRLTDRGASDSEIGRLAGVTPRTVLRWRVALGLPSGWARRAS